MLVPVRPFNFRDRRPRVHDLKKARSNDLSVDPPDRLDKLRLPGACNLRRELMAQIGALAICASRLDEPN